MATVEGMPARRTGTPRVRCGFGLRFDCSFPLPFPSGAAGPADLELVLAEPSQVQEAWSGCAGDDASAESTQDGLRYRAERGTAGDHRFVYGERATFHLSPDGHTLLCAPADPSAPEWRRVLLDSVLATVALLRGFEALHAAAVLAPGGAVALMARTGGGKTTLAAELLARGFSLISDDILVLSHVEGRVVGHPAPPVMNLPAGAQRPAGDAIATIGDETWFAVHDVSPGPAPIAAFCLIDRRPGLEPAIVPGPGSPLDLLAHGLRSGAAADRRQARFELFADLATQAQAYVLEADHHAGAAELADLLQAGVPALSPAHAGAIQ